MSTLKATVQDEGRSFLFTWTQPPDRLEIGERFPMKLTVRRTAGDGSFPQWRLGLELSGLLGALKSVQPGETNLYALLPGGPPEQSTSIESSGEYLIQGTGYSVGDTFDLSVRVSSPKLFLGGWTAQEWKYKLTRD